MKKILATTGISSKREIIKFIRQDDEKSFKLYLKRFSSFLDYTGADLIKWHTTGADLIKWHTSNK